LGGNVATIDTKKAVKRYCLFRAEHINQMLEVCNQMKIMGLNVYLQLMVRPNALTQAQKRQFNNDTNVATQNKV
jgi:hypothetical protein